MIASLVERAGPPTSWPAGTTTGGRPSGSRRSRPTRRTASPRTVDEASSEEEVPDASRRAGADHRRRARRARHRPGRRRRARGRRRHRHAGDAVTAAGCPVDIVTGDRDLFQLVDDANDVRVLYTARGGVRNPDVVDEAFLREKYGVPNGAAYADMASCAVTPATGCRAWPGIGEKTAAKLITTYGYLAGAPGRRSTAGDPAIKGAQRARLEAGGRVPRRRAEGRRGRPGRTHRRGRPRAPTRVADPALMSRLAVEHGLTNPFDRVVSALGLG